MRKVAWVAGLAVAVLALCAAQPALAQLTSAESPIINLDDSRYEVVYLGRTYDGSNTTFGYRVTVTGDPALSHFVVEIPECEPALLVVAYAPADGVVIGLDPTTGLTGIKWDGEVKVGESREFSVTFHGEVAEGLTGIGIKAGGLVVLGERPGPACDPDPAQGCGVAFWRMHCRMWVGYTCCSRLGSAFTYPAPLASLSGVSMHMALRYGDGTTVLAAARTLSRAGVAALLNAAHPQVNYPLSEGQVIATVNAALASMSRPTMLAAAAELEQLNNQTCPLRCGGGCCPR